METSQVIQEVSNFYTISGQNNIEKKAKSRKREGKFFVFLVYFQKQGGLFPFFKNPP